MGLFSSADTSEHASRTMKTEARQRFDRIMEFSLLYQ
jgi:hypothetical protein